VATKTNKKFIHYECKNTCGGWADRVKGILSAYAWALLTNRTFVLDIQHPCPLELVLEPNEVDWRANLDFIRQQTGREHVFPTLSHKRRTVEYGWSDYIKLKTENILEFAKDVDIISINSGLPFMDAFSVNPHLKKRIAEIGYEPERFKVPYVMHKWYGKLFKLRPEMREAHSKFVERTKKSLNYTLICAQV
jgi:hypothetical protein